MNVRCPACSRLYRIADERVTGGATLRCTGCGHQFAGNAPAEGERPGSQPHKDPIEMNVMQPVDRPAGPQADRRRPRPEARGGTAPPPTPDRLAILADAGRPFRDTLRPVLQEFGFRIETVEQGTEA